MAYDLTRRKLLRSAGALALAPPLLGVLSCGRDTDAAEFSGVTMGTTWRVTIATPPTDLDRRTLSADLQRILSGLDARMSTWREDSEVSLYNSRPIGAPAPVSEDTAAVVAEALRVSRVSGGAFDPTIGPLVNLWGFGPSGVVRKAPTSEAVDLALAQTGARHIRLPPGLPVLTKQIPGLEIDLSGIAKGYGVDQVARHLDRLGLTNHLVEVGGELRAGGVNQSGKPWRIGVEMPVAGARSVRRAIEVSAGGVATSGNYRNFFEQDDLRYSHVIDPRSGQPVTHSLASVTVVAQTCMQADALSTALMVMGPEAGVELARRLRLAALFIAKLNGGLQDIATPEFAEYDLA